MGREHQPKSLNLLSRHAGKTAAAFVAGFAIFLIISFRLRDKQGSITSSPIRGVETALSEEFADLPLELHSPALTLPPLRLRTARKQRADDLPTEPRPMEAVAQTPLEQAPTPAAASPIRQEPAARPERKVASADSTLAVRLSGPLTTRENKTGEGFSGVLSAPVLENGVVVFPEGSAVKGRIVEARRAGLIGRHSVLSIELTAITAPDGRAIPVRTTQWYANGSGSRLRKIPFLPRNKYREEQGAAADSGSDVSLPSNAAVSFRLMVPAVVQ